VRPVGVVFKTGEDYRMPEYKVGSFAWDLAPGDYQGSAHALCEACARRWVKDDRVVRLKWLATEVASGRVVARRATWWVDVDRPERGLVVKIEEEAPLGADAIRALIKVPDGLAMAHVALFQGDLRLHPEDTRVDDPAIRRWCRIWNDEADKRLRALGWPDGIHPYVDAIVRVDADNRVWLG
jgi:hypothetical protein